MSVTLATANEHSVPTAYVGRTNRLIISIQVAYKNENSALTVSHSEQIIDAEKHVIQELVIVCP